VINAVKSELGEPTKARDGVTPNTINMDGFMERLLNEQKELNEKLSKLNTFINGDKFVTVDSIQQSLLKIQASAMKTYSDCLDQRITYLNQTVTTA
jgi:hypothetical protein